MEDNKLVSHNAEVFNECLEISRKKSHDYAGDEDPMRNFRLSEYLGAVNTPDGIFVRMCDKVSRIARGLHNPLEVSDESMEDTCHDLINYCSILLYALKEKNDTSDKSS